jgi:TPR repeat protein
MGGHGCEEDEARSLSLARESSESGSRYGQFTLGRLYERGEGALAANYTKVVAFYRLAAAQGLDEAQCSLGHMYSKGRGVARDCDEALRLYQLAATQGHPHASFIVARCQELGRGVRKNTAGYTKAAGEVSRLKRKRRLQRKRRE